MRMRKRGGRTKQEKSEEAGKMGKKKMTAKAIPVIAFVPSFANCSFTVSTATSGIRLPIALCGGEVVSEVNKTMREESEDSFW